MGSLSSKAPSLYLHPLHGEGLVEAWLTARPRLLDTAAQPAPCSPWHARARGRLQAAPPGPQLWLGLSRGWPFELVTPEGLSLRGAVGPVSQAVLAGSVASGTDDWQHLHGPLPSLHHWM